MATLTDFLTPPSVREVRDRLLSLLALAGFPVAAWQPGSVPRHLVEAFATFGADLATLIIAIAKSGFLDTADDRWLDLLAASVFNERRKEAVSTRGLVLLQDAAGQGPFPIDPDAYWISNRARTRRFRSAEKAVVPASGSALVLFEAEGPGADWNLSDGELVEILTPGGTGLVVTNPARGTSSWISVPGADREKDEALRQRCRDKWATLGSGSTEAAYRYWASSATPEVTRVQVSGASAGDPTVVVRLAGALGPVSQEAVRIASAAVESRKPLNVPVRVETVTTYRQLVQGTIFTAYGTPADALLARASEVLRAYAASVPIGGTVYFARLVGALVGLEGVVNVRLAVPSGDVVLASSAVVVPDLQLSVLEGG